MYYLGSNVLQVPLPSPGVSINSSQPVAEVLWPMSVAHANTAVWCNSGLHLIGHKGKSAWLGEGTSRLQRLTRQGLFLCHMWTLFHRETIFRVHSHIEIIREQKDGKHLGFP